MSEKAISAELSLEAYANILLHSYDRCIATFSGIEGQTMSTNDARILVENTLSVRCMLACAAAISKSELSNLAWFDLKDCAAHLANILDVRNEVSKNTKQLFSHEAIEKWLSEDTLSAMPAIYVACAYGVYLYPKYEKAGFKRIPRAKAYAREKRLREFKNTLDFYAISYDEHNSPLFRIANLVIDALCYYDVSAETQSYALQILTQIGLEEKQMGVMFLCQDQFFTLDQQKDLLLQTIAHGIFTLAKRRQEKIVLPIKLSKLNVEWVFGDTEQTSSWNELYDAMQVRFKNHVSNIDTAKFFAFQFLEEKLTYAIEQNVEGEYLECLFQAYTEIMKKSDYSKAKECIQREINVLWDASNNEVLTNVLLNLLLSLDRHTYPAILQSKDLKFEDFL